jgi:hypothetical protein
VRPPLLPPAVAVPLPAAVAPLQPEFQPVGTCVAFPPIAFVVVQVTLSLWYVC